MAIIISSIRVRLFYFCLFVVILICLVTAVAVQLMFWVRFASDMGGFQQKSDAESVEIEWDWNTDVELVVNDIQDDASDRVPPSTEQNCTYHTCFDVYRCPRSDSGLISVYVYPPSRYMSSEGKDLTIPVSREFVEMLEAIKSSEYYTLDPQSACLLVPSIDLLNQGRMSETDRKNTAHILQALPQWVDGTNHLLFNMLPGSSPDFNTSLDVLRGRSILAGGGFSTWSYRQTYDISIPIYNSLVKKLKQDYLKQSNGGRIRRWLIISPQVGLHPDYIKELELAARISNDPLSLLILKECTTETGQKTDIMSERCDQSGTIYDYPEILREAEFCVVLRGIRLGQVALYDCLMAGAIPIIVANGYIVPFSEVIDWTRAAIKLDESELHKIITVAESVSTDRIDSMRKQVHFLFSSYFSSPAAITLTTLRIINDRVFPYAARKYPAWNDPPELSRIRGIGGKNSDVEPLFLPLQPAKSAGYTAVILTYDRLESLFRIIQLLSGSPSLVKILVIWNNQLKAPPPAAVWPKVNKTLKVVQTRQNRLSNRFYPYDEIETEAILSLDDDILMLTVDELEFAYDVWREFPDRLVGFPSRLHLWSHNTSSWRYESEWTSEISMVLTGAAFYHKYYHYLYTNAMPGDIKSWVDEQMNCEDIAFNFMVANSTRKPPIKVTPRQKFRCPECLGGAAILSADLGDHMVERSECINRFSKIYGMMPLKTVEFRADPVLYKDSRVPQELHWYREVGSL